MVNCQQITAIWTCVIGSEVRNEPQRSGEAEQFATQGEAEGSEAHNQREEEWLSAKRGSGGTSNSEMSEAILNVVVKRWNQETAR